MPESTEEIKKMEARIAKLDEQQKQLKDKKRVLRNRLSQQARKARTKRLIEKGAILEKFQGKGADKISADDSLTALVQLQNDFDSLKAFTSNVKYRKNKPDEPTRTVYDNWEEQKNQN
ncbi:hypothetical protein AYO51_01300 [Lactiplantibacillus plantarum]|uniref:hypothetical protein n=1 Tax=Lactiplantibacillus plantarum TaxID=1590 RepID=UPI000786FCA3|nr:hypothetical protein [Lactiplantibacillus plantarum]KYK52343.1 hypothetical protein AYO51_01300 [Lactiplantibacillus plantarum]KYM69687.1 hypothetical protein AZJ01_15675 [Lactiplantibacillus plantarum]